MTLSTTALVNLNQAKSFLKVDTAASLHIAAEYVGTGTGTEDDFTLDHTPVEGTLKLYVNNTLKVETTDFTLTVAAIKFGAGDIPTNGQIVTASYDYAASSNTFESYDDDILERLIEAATKKAQDYTGRQFINATLTEYHQGDGTDILRLYRRPINSVTTVAYKQEDAFTGDGSTLVFALSETPKASSYTVYINGTLKTETTDYAISGTTLTFVVAPADDADIVIHYEVSLSHDDFIERINVGRLKGSWNNSYIYEIVYSAGYGSDRDTVQPLLPDAVTAVLMIIANLYNNRLGLSQESVSGIGSVTYDEIPELAKKLLWPLKV
jgi:hypothetical protein